MNGNKKEIFKRLKCVIHKRKSGQPDHMRPADQNAAAKKRFILRICSALLCLLLIISGLLICIKVNQKKPAQSQVQAVTNGLLTDPGDTGSELSSSELTSNKKYAAFIPQTVLKGFSFSNAAWYPKTEALDLYYYSKTGSATIDILFNCTPKQLKTTDVNDPTSYDVPMPAFNASDLSLDVIKKTQTTCIDVATNKQQSKYEVSMVTGSIRIDFYIDDYTENLNAENIYNLIKSIPALKDVIK